MDFQKRSELASINCTLPRRADGLRLFGSQTYVEMPVLENVGRQGDDSFNPVFFEHPPPDFAFPRSGPACEKRRTVHDDANAAALLVIAHF